MKYINHLVPIILDKRVDINEPLDGDEVDTLIEEIRHTINVHEGNEELSKEEQYNPEISQFENKVLINPIDLASGLAYNRLIEYADSLTEEQYNTEFPNGVEIIDDDDEGCVIYTDEAQDVFDDYYNYYLSLII